jgi:anthranilate synthase component 2
MRILVIDFYDSFVFNLVHYFEEHMAEVVVLSDREIELSQLDFLLGFNGIVLSPGPGLPQETLSMMGVLSFVKGKVPVLGVCLGMQGIALALGGNLYNLNEVRHGFAVNLIQKPTSTIGKGINSNVKVGLYHSWAVENLREEWIGSVDEKGVVMSLECPEFKWYGVQFHPESVLTPDGKKMIKNVIEHIFT